MAVLLPSTATCNNFLKKTKIIYYKFVISLYYSRYVSHDTIVASSTIEPDIYFHFAKIRSRVLPFK